MNEKQKEYIADILGLLYLEKKDLESKKIAIEKRLVDMTDKITQLKIGFSDQEIRKAMEKQSKFAAKMVADQQALQRTS